jgi:hypothetical protein
MPGLGQGFKGYKMTIRNFRSRNLLLNESTFLDTIYVYLCQIEGLRNWGIEGLKDKINKLNEIEFLQFLNSKIPEFLNS